ncbi:FixJ family two-component response regulator [Bradyrhizobium sp. I1.7.5]
MTEEVVGLAGWVHIVDDDAAFAKAMERRLRLAGYDVAVYATAQELLDRLPSDSIPGCILLDVQIPDLDGPELQRRLGEVGSTVPIIFLTGYADIPATVRAIKAGAEDFLRSRFHPTTFSWPLNVRLHITRRSTSDGAN